MREEVRKYFSVFGLYARSSIFKVLGILLLMSAVQLAMFAKLYYTNISAGDVGAVGSGFIGQGSSFTSEYSFLSYMEMSKIPQICFVGFVLITVVLCMTGTEYGSKTGYTLKRLSISEKSTFFLQTGYNIFVYILFGAVQMAVVFLIGTIFARTISADGLYHQTLFLAFYQDYFLHALFPMEDGLLWWRNICWLIALGMATAEFSYVQRRGNKFNMSLIVLVVMIIVFGGNSWGFSNGPIGALGNCIFTSFVVWMIILYILACNIFSKEGAYEE